MARITQRLLTLSEEKVACSMNSVMKYTMLIHSFAKYKRDAPLGLLVQKYATSRSNMMKTS